MRHSLLSPRFFHLIGAVAFALTCSVAFAQDAPPPGAPDAPSVGEGDATSADGTAATETSDTVDDAAKAQEEAAQKAAEAKKAKEEAEAKAAAEAQAKAEAEAKAAEQAKKEDDAKAEAAPDAKDAKDGEGAKDAKDGEGAKDAKDGEGAKDAKEAINCDEVCKKEEPAPSGPKQGFNYNLSLGITGSLLHSLAVVGQPDGLTLQLGGVLNGGVLYLRKNHSWETKLNVQNAWTLTPALPNTPIKSADRVDLSTQYTYTIPVEGFTWVGPYVRAQLVSSALPGQLVSAEPTTVQKTLSDGTTVIEEQQGTKGKPASFELTSFFEPLVITENIGATAVSPFEEFTYFVPKARLGVGGQHVIVRDGFAIADDAGTEGIIELQQMSIENSLGVNADIEVTGKILKNVSYGVIARFYYPLYIFENNDAAIVDRINADVLGTVSVQLMENLKLDYALTVRRVPAVSKDWQVQNSLLVSAGFNIF